MAPDAKGVCVEPACFGPGGVDVFEAVLVGDVGGVIGNADDVPADGLMGSSARLFAAGIKGVWALASGKASDVSTSWGFFVPGSATGVSVVSVVVTVVNVGGVATGASAALAETPAGTIAIAVAAGAVVEGAAELAASEVSWSWVILVQSLSMSSCSWIDGFFFCIAMN